jgi:hypothetical protein
MPFQNSTGSLTKVLDARDAASQVRQSSVARSLCAPQVCLMLHPTNSEMHCQVLKPWLLGLRAIQALQLLPRLSLHLVTAAVHTQKRVRYMLLYRTVSEAPK